MHDAKTSISQYLLDTDCRRSCATAFPLGYSKAVVVISAGVPCPLVGGCPWELRIGNVKNWHAEDSFWQIPCRRHDAARFFCLHRQCLRRLLLANGDLLIHTGDMLAKIYTTVSCSRLQYSRGRDGVTACGEMRGEERLMSISSVFNRPYFLGRYCPNGPTKSGRQSAHDHGRNLRQTTSSQPESLHSSHSKPNHLLFYTKPYAPDMFLGT